VFIERRRMHRRKFTRVPHQGLVRSHLRDLIDLLTLDVRGSHRVPTLLVRLVTVAHRVIQEVSHPLRIGTLHELQPLLPLTLAPAYTRDCHNQGDNYEPRDCTQDDHDGLVADEVVETKAPDTTRAGGLDKPDGGEVRSYGEGRR